MRHRFMLQFILGLITILFILGFSSVNAFAASQDHGLNEPNCPVLGLPRQLEFFDSAPKNDPCDGRGTSIVVLTGYRTLYLCEKGRTVADYDVAIGFMGIIKTREGDMRTPLGTYELGRPRESYSGFHTFIPIGYPTAKQKALGYTGKNVGIHGPARRFRCAGFLNTAIDWTDGCLAVADDLFIVEIADWMRAHPEAKWIHILPPRLLLRTVEPSL